MTRALAHFASIGVTTARVMTEVVLPVPNIPGLAGRQRNQAQVDPTIPAANQRQSRTLQPHPAGGIGLRAPLPQRNRTRRGLPRVPSHLQSRTRPHRTARQLTRQPRTQPGRSVHLVDETPSAGRVSPRTAWKDPSGIDRDHVCEEASAGDSAGVTGPKSGRASRTTVMASSAVM